MARSMLSNAFTAASHSAFNCAATSGLWVVNSRSMPADPLAAATPLTNPNDTMSRE